MIDGYKDEDGYCYSGYSRITSYCFSDDLFDDYVYRHGYYNFSPCSASCKGCFEPNDDRPMNCKACRSDYYMTQDTHSCYKGDIDNYYLANTSPKTYQKCHSNCLRCTSGSNYNCIKCQPGYFMKSTDNSCHDNIITGHYYNKSSKKLERCNGNCLECTSSENKNCITCASSLYLTEDNHSCVDRYTNGYYLDTSNNILRKCHPLCKRCSNPPTGTSMNCDECQTNYYMNDDTKSCYLQDIDNYYKNPNTMKFVRCHVNCLRCTTTQNSNCIKCINNYNK